MVSVWKISAVAGAALVAFAGAYLVVDMMWISRQREVLLERRLELEQRIASAPRTRVVLRGEARPGDAWEHYGRATRKLGNGALRRAVDDLAENIAESDSTDLERELGSPPDLTGEDGVLTHLAAGARSTQGRFEYDYSAVTAIETPDVFACVALGELARLEARRLFATGDAVGGVKQLLDAAQLGRDLADHGTLVSARVGQLVLEGVAEELEERQAGLAIPARAAARGGLERLLSDLPSPLEPLWVEERFVLEVATEIEALDRVSQEFDASFVHRFFLRRDAIEAAQVIGERNRVLEPHVEERDATVLQDASRSADALVRRSAGTNVFLPLVEYRSAIAGWTDLRQRLETLVETLR